MSRRLKWYRTTSWFVRENETYHSTDQRKSVKGDDGWSRYITDCGITLSVHAAHVERGLAERTMLPCGNCFR